MIKQRLQIEIFQLIISHVLKKGSKMHIDPWLTDAFNALISGEKWWVSLPKDLYEFRDEFKCDSLCSDVPNNFHKLIGVWFVHILPQIR